HSKNKLILSNRKIITENNFLQFSTYFFLILFAGILAFKTPIYLKNQETVSDYTEIIKTHDSLYAEIAVVSGKKKKIEADKKIAAIILSRKDEYLDLIDQTIQLVPEGVMLDSIDYTKGKHVLFEGKAASDLDINLFLVNLREQIGKPELNNLGRILVPVNTNVYYDNNPDNESESDAESEAPSNELKTFKIKLNL
ncbi:PilN domain-containing protein, partial [Pelagibacteraceae bacterium]|nr:PilN domain-containing protein [Pelagibacteraceae bacterium]